MSEERMGGGVEQPDTHASLFVGISDRLWRAMQARGVSADVLGAQSGVAPNTILRILKGENVSVRSLARLAKSLARPCTRSHPT
jgi:hypothetical protein